MNDRQELASYDAAVVGAGPAGIAAAVMLDEGGAEVALIDRAPKPGGQIYAQPETEQAQGHQLPSRAQELLSELEKSSVTCFFNTVAYDTPVPHTLALSCEEPFAIRADALLFAAGSTERVIPFRGWTLPGVMTAGGISRLLKTQGVLPGQRFLVTGTGPLLPNTAHELAAAGADVVAVIENAPLRNRRGLLNTWRFPEFIGRAAPVLWTLVRQSIPYTWQHAVTEVSDMGEHITAKIKRLDTAGFPTGQVQAEFVVDAVVVHQGLIPEVSLPGIAEVPLDYNHNTHNWVPAVDAWGRSNVEGVQVLGDGAGILGAEAAEVRGRLAALAALEKQGLLSTAEFKQRSIPLLDRLSGYEEYWELMSSVYPVPRGLYAAIPDDTIVCRCEDVRVSDIRAAITDGAVTTSQLKSWTRAGMGPCQGKVCEHTIRELMRDLRGVDYENVGHFTKRPPAEPISVDVLAEAPAEL